LLSSKLNWIMSEPILFQQFFDMNETKSLRSRMRKVLNLHYQCIELNVMSMKTLIGLCIGNKISSNIEWFWRGEKTL
jgi:hypothetical protein